MTARSAKSALRTVQCLAPVVLSLLAVRSTPAAQSDRPLGAERQIRLNITNGTSGGPADAEKVTVYRLDQGMTPVIEESNVGSQTTIRGIPGTGAQPVLLQITYAGVNYNEPVGFTDTDIAQAEIVVYETTSDWDPAAMSVTTSRILFRRIGNQMSIDRVYVIDNRTDPPQTFLGESGSFLFHLPTAELKEVRGVTASGASGMPVPQQSFPVDGRPGVFATRTAMKPGETQIGVSYDVDYSDASHFMETEAFYPLSELLALVAPTDVEVSADGWQLLGNEPEGRFSVARLADVAVGDRIQIRLSGGSADSADLVGSAPTPNAAPPPGGQRITHMPDPSRSQKWIVVLLMGAALTYGLVHSVMARKSRRELSALLGALDARHEAGDLSTDEYRSHRNRLQQELAATPSKPGK